VSVNERGAAIAVHYQRIWSSVPSNCDWPPLALRAGDLPDGFAVLRVAPAAGDRPWRYGTVCMSAPTDDYAIELHMICDGPEDECAAILTMTAYFHRTTARLDVGHSVNFGRPWVAKSRCTFGLVSLPYLGGPAWEWCSIGAGQRVRCLWLLPITPEEAKFKRESGTDALEERFEASGFNYANPFRPSVV